MGVAKPGNNAAKTIVTKPDIMDFMKYVQDIDVIDCNSWSGKIFLEYFKQYLWKNNDMFFRVEIDDKNIEKSLAILKKHGLTDINYWIQAIDDYHIEYRGKEIKLNRSYIYVHFISDEIPEKYFWSTLIYESQSKQSKNKAKTCCRA